MQTRLTPAALRASQRLAAHAASIAAPMRPSAPAQQCESSSTDYDATAAESMQLGAFNHLGVTFERCRLPSMLQKTA